MFSFLKSKAKADVVGLELRADGVSLALAKPDEQGQLQIALCCDRACDHSEQSAVLEDLISEMGAAGLPCNLVLSSLQYKTYPIERPKVEDSELADASRWRIKDLLEFDLEDAVTDVYDFPDDALRGRASQLNVVVCRKSVIEDAVSLLNRSSIVLENIDIVDLSIRNIAQRLSDDDQRTIAVLYLREGAGMMVLVKGKTLYFSRHFDFSLQALNEPAQQDSVIQNLALEVQRSFDYFQSQMGQVPPQTVYLIGPTPTVPLANMLGGNISASVELLDLSICYSEEKNAGQTEINSFAAIGAALREVQA